ncbi:uncharacterized protein LOC144445235 [Glandiceps talaboti]
MSKLIPLHGEEGQDLLKTSSHHQPAIIQLFAKQTHRTFCAIQTAVIAMNAMEGTLQETDGEQFFKEGTFFDSSLINGTIEKSTVEKQGCTLKEMANLYQAFGYDVSMYYAGDSNVDEFRQVAMETLLHSDCQGTVIINYHMGTLGQGLFYGHVSPLAAYHKETDRLLLMDVWPETEEIWATTADLFRSMNTIDNASNKTRGFLTVHKNKQT